jgi:hypothetical protein
MFCWIVVERAAIELVARALDPGRENKRLRNVYSNCLGRELDFERMAAISEARYSQILSKTIGRSRRDDLAVSRDLDDNRVVRCPRIPGPASNSRAVDEIEKPIERSTHHRSNDRPPVLLLKTCVVCV